MNSIATEPVNCPVDLHWLSESQPSLCIPWIFSTIDENFIHDTISKLSLGKISSIEFLERVNQKGQRYKIGFIHFEKWYWTPAAQETRKRLITGNEIKIIYNAPWFWKASAKRWSPHEHKQNEYILDPNKNHHQITRAPESDNARLLPRPAFPKRSQCIEYSYRTTCMQEPEPEPEPEPQLVMREDQGIDVDYSSCPLLPPKLIRQTNCTRS
jgi:hypothetical protein